MSEPIDFAARSCIGCKHWTFHPGHPDWSEVTPGDSWSAQCTKADADGSVRWYLSGYDEDDSAWFKTMQQAKTCPDYDPRPGAPQ